MHNSKGVENMKMPNKDKKLFFGLFIVAIFLCCQATIGARADSCRLQTQGEKNSYFNRKNDKRKFSDLIIWKEFKSLVLNRKIPLFGYKLDTTSTNPIERDETATLKLFQHQQGLVDIKINTKFNDFFYNNIPVESEICKASEGLIVYTYEMEDPLEGFFMKVYMLNNNSWVNLAFDGGSYQLSYDGILQKGFSQSNLFSNQDLEQLLRESQEKGVQIYNERYLGELRGADGQYSTLSITQTQYGISHEGYDFRIDYPSDLPDDYWEPYTCIDIGLHRMRPSESQVKSDLQYYNKYRVIEGSGYNRDIRAYSMVTHGGPEWDIFEIFWFIQYRVDTIYPDEVEDLWYELTIPHEGIYIYVYPQDTIVMVDACFSYSDGGSPTMAHAFVDYGADAFVGSTIEVPGDSDDFMYVFWESLCQDDETVSTATTNLCDTYGHNWNLGDEWKILGSSSATIPN